jgi:D-alanyl-D-alanine carboxypeptidase (penicillin-binding protein 5/6)
LLVCEALEDGLIKPEDKVSVSAYAASMGGSQVFLEEGERFSVEELIKCTVIASANDAAVALAEHCAGSEAAFVSKMNERARLLGLTNTSFENVTGLDDDTVNHYTSARDIALMSRELIKHEIILKYSSIWQDTIRDGEFTLTNTNRLVRYYDGCNGLKTGSTDKAGYCVSATAERDGLTLIAVVMGAESRDKRNAAARAMLDYGFSSFALYRDEAEFLEEVPVLSGKCDGVAAISGGFSTLVEKSKLSKVEKHFDIPESLTAPIKKGDVIGSIVYTLDDGELGRANIYADSDVERITFIDIYLRILSNIISGV